jgi:hypothetical protein
MCFGDVELPLRDLPGDPREGTFDATCMHCGMPYGVSVGHAAVDHPDGVASPVAPRNSLFQRAMSFSRTAASIRSMASPTRRTAPPLAQASQSPPVRASSASSTIEESASECRYRDVLGDALEASRNGGRRPRRLVRENV